MLLFLAALFIGKPVFLSPLDPEPAPALSIPDILNSMPKKTILGYAPNISPYDEIMAKAALSLNTTVMGAASENGLNMLLSNQSQKGVIQNPIMWIIFKPSPRNQWKFLIRNTERARLVNPNRGYTNTHLRTGFLAAQVAISSAIVEFITDEPPNYEITLSTMPVSTLMQQSMVRKALSLMLMCYTLAFLPAILETEALVVWETENNLKRALRMRSVGYTSMYLSWLVYTYLTALPVCMLGAIMLILIFRWIHFITALLIEFAYISVMAMMALIMAMFHKKPLRACIWTTLFTLLMTYLAELLVHHQYDTVYVGLTFLLKVALPPLGLISAFNDFALLTTGPGESKLGITYMVASWSLLISIYFGILLLLQRTIGRERAIGGQVSWKSIIFKKIDDIHVVRTVPAPSRSEHGKVQEVDEFQARAISFRDVCKTIMGRPILNNVTFDIFRGEYTILFSEKVEEKTVQAIDDLITGLALPESGEVRVFGENMADIPAPLNNMYMIGYCHRSDTLIDDLTVHEHFTLFSAVCLWHQSSSMHLEYRHIRYKQLLTECNLRDVRYTRVRDLDLYYKAQLCWALAKLLEPRVIIIPDFYDEPTYRAVIIDKIMKYRNSLSIISLDHSSLQLQYADRIFVFCSNILVFGGTPAYMFFRHGREYQVRLTLRADTVAAPMGTQSQLLLKRISAAGGTIRAHLGTMLVLRIPLTPTKVAADFIKDLTENSTKYGLLPKSINLSVPDFEEVVKRAVKEANATFFKTFPGTQEDNQRTSNAIKRIFESPPPTVNRKFRLHFKQIARKFIYFHLSHKLLFILTIVFAMISGLLLGHSYSTSLQHILNTDKIGLTRRDHLTVEYLNKETILVIRADKSNASQCIANAYVMSETNATLNQVKKMSYIALPNSENFREYLMTRAIDSPQNYVYNYAYGMDVSVISNNTIKIQALYSPLHKDYGAAPRSIARVYMSLIRHYTHELNATITVEDEPFALDLMGSLWMQELSKPPLFLQFLLILTISHITLLPSLEQEMIRHTQKSAANFSPLLYWATLYLCDVIFYCMLVGMMTVMMIGIVVITTPPSLLSYYDLAILPATLLLYGMGCVPQAYLFSLGPRVAINVMAFVIVNMVFGETTIVAKLFYGDALSYVLYIMSLSPQFNMAYAYVKVKQIFLHNIECPMFKSKNLCTSNTFHKCCAKCGVLQKCFSRKGYFDDAGILREVKAMGVTAVFFTTLLLLNEYKVFKFLWMTIDQRLHKDLPCEQLKEGTKNENDNVKEKLKTLTEKNAHVRKNTFGDYLCVANLSAKEADHHIVRNVYLGLDKGEALAITGLKRHGRLRLCEVLAGYRLMCNGNAWAMSKWRLDKQPIQYSRQVSICCEQSTAPPWMTLADALCLIGCLRGLSDKSSREETKNLIEALEMHHISNKIVKDLQFFDRTRFRFAAAIIAAPPIIILDELTYGQKNSVRRTMYSLLYLLRKRGHAILITSSSIESHIPVTNRLAFIIDGVIYDIDTIDNLIERHSRRGFTIVVHLKNEVDFVDMFSHYFRSFNINDYSEVLVNVQVYDPELDCNLIFQIMEELVKDYSNHVYSYIVTDWTIDYIFNTILVNEKGLENTTGFTSLRWTKKIISTKPKKMPSQGQLAELTPYQTQYELTSLIGLPWSVIFHNSDYEPNTEG